MEKNIEKGEFLTKVEDFANSMSEITSEREGVKRGFVVRAVKKVKGEDGTKSIISLAGDEQKIAEVIAEFSTHEETKGIFVQGMKLGEIKRFCEKIKMYRTTKHLPL